MGVRVSWYCARFSGVCVCVCVCRECVSVCHENEPTLPSAHRGSDIPTTRWWMIVLTSANVSYMFAPASGGSLIVRNFL